MIRPPLPIVNRRRLFTWLCAVGVASLQAAGAAWPAGDRPVPRFVSIKSGEVNVRSGPGERYPVKWKYIQPGLPVEIIAEWETWRKIRDWEGAEGWVHSALLSGKRSVIVVGDTRTLYRRADIDSPPVVRLKPGIVAEIEDCDRDWCRVEVRNYRGWLRRGDVWGLYPDEIIE